MAFLLKSPIQKPINDIRVCRNISLQPLHVKLNSEHSKIIKTNIQRHEEIWTR
jgi:hypothetical protein